MEDKTQRIGFFIKVINNQLRCHYNLVLKSYDLTKAQFDTLVFLKKMQEDGVEVNQRDLETFFHISNPTVSSMLNRLEAKDLIMRKPSKEDRRIRYVVITDKATELISGISSILSQSRERMFCGLTQEELEEGPKFLEHILFNLTGKEENEFDIDFIKAD